MPSIYPSNANEGSKALAEQDRPRYRSNSLANPSEPRLN